MDLEFFHKILTVDSTSGKEGELADLLAVELEAPGRRVETFEVGDGSKNLLVSWGTPKVIFCTHLDTVPPYVPPTIVTRRSSDDGMPLGAVNSVDWGSDTLGSSAVYGLSGVHQHRDTRVSEVFSENGSSDVTRRSSDDGMPLGAVNSVDWGSDTFGSSAVYGRGTCDAKGQIFAMYEACKILEARGYDGFGLLLLAGEETGSHGARAFSSMADKAGKEWDWIIVGEPTDNCMASAAKGTKSFEVSFTGEAFHSGYPENGLSAINLFNDFLNALRSIVFPKDDILGETTWNIGKLLSDNPQNILSDNLTCRVYFRTTFESDEMVSNVMKNMAGPEAKLRFGKRKVQDGSDMVAKDVALWQKRMSVRPLGGDTPSKFELLEGFPSKPVSFGSDAPQLKCFRHKVLFGPGSILVAHRPEEHIGLKELGTAVRSYVRMYEMIIEKQQ